MNLSEILDLESLAKKQSKKNLEYRTLCGIPFCMDRLLILEDRESLFIAIDKYLHDFSDSFLNVSFLCILKQCCYIIAFLF